MPLAEDAPPEFAAGYLAYGDELKHFDNPYSAALEPEKFAQWRDGFREAEDDSKSYWWKYR